MKTLIALLFVTAAPAFAGEAPVTITCGNTPRALQVVFEISPLARTISYTAYRDGQATHEAFGPTMGIYDTASLSFGGAGYPDRISVHGSYAQIVRVNHFAAITLELEKNWDSKEYYVAAFSDGHETNTVYGRPTVVKEVDHPEFIGQTCKINGM